MRDGLAGARGDAPSVIRLEADYGHHPLHLGAPRRGGPVHLGKIVEIGPPVVMYAAPGNPYAQALLSAVPVPDPESERKRKRVVLQGDVPSPVNPPDGCRVHTRCWLFEKLGKPEECRTIDPPLRVLQTDHGAACHFVDKALESDVGIAHIDHAPVRHGTPEAALATLRNDEGKAPPAATIVQ